MSDQRPPTTPPAYFDPLAGDEAGQPPRLAMALILDDLHHAARHAPRWLLETGPGGTVALDILAHAPGTRLVLAAALGGARVEITLAPHDSGWLSLVATHRGRTVFRAWLDRPYERYELWPPGAEVTAPRSLEPPGRIGKRRNWINLAAGAWPQLASLADASGIVALAEAESPLHNPAISLE